MRLNAFLVSLQCIYIAVQLSQAEECDTSRCTCLPDIIKCDNTYLEGFPTMKDGLKSVLLTKTNLGFTELNQRRLEAYSLTNITELLLKKCLISIIQAEAFEKLAKSLQVLEVTTKSVENNAFAGLRLSKLQLNGLVFLNEHSFSRIKAIETLEINDGQLTKFPINDLTYLAKHGSLRHLNIASNKITTLDESYDDLFINLQTLNLSKNPWHCDCNLAWLIKRYKQLRIRFNPSINLNQEEPKCASPPQLKGKSFSDLLAKYGDLKTSQDLMSTPPIFLCPKLELNAFDIDFRPMRSDNAVGYLACNMTGAKGLTIAWSYMNKEENRVQIIPSDESSVSTIQHLDNLFNYNGPNGNALVPDVSRIYSKLTIKRLNHIDTYKCTGQDNFSNISTSISVMWPTMPFNSVEATPIPDISDNSDGNTVFPSKHQGAVFEKQFSLIELLGAILGTFLFTTMLFIIGYRLTQSFNSNLSSIKSCKPSSANNNMQSPTGTDSSNTSSGLRKVDDINTQTIVGRGQLNGNPVMVYSNGMLVTNSHANQLNHLQTQPLMPYDASMYEANPVLYDVPRNVSQGSQNSLKNSADTNYPPIFQVPMSTHTPETLPSATPIISIPPPPSTPQPALPIVSGQPNQFYKTMMQMGLQSPQAPHFNCYNGSQVDLNGLSKRHQMLQQQQLNQQPPQ